MDKARLAKRGTAGGPKEDSKEGAVSASAMHEICRVNVQKDFALA